MSRRLSAVAAAGVSALALTAGFLGFSGTAVADETAPNESTDVICETPKEIRWESVSYLKPGEPDVERDDKDITYDGDVAIDGWTGGAGDGGIDGWTDGASGNPSFRVIVGTVVPLEGVTTTVEVLDTSATDVEGQKDAAFLAPSAAESPAKAATPERYKKVVLDDLDQPERVDDNQAIDWTVTNDQKMPAGSSAMYGVQVDRSTLTGTAPIIVKLTVEGTATAVPCPDEDEDGYTDIQNGDLSECSVDWRVGATIDRRLTDMSNNGYRWGVNPETGKGHLKAHHWISTDGKLQWRIPVATKHAMEPGAQLVLDFGDNWSADAAQEITDYTGVLWEGNEPKTLFNRFTGIDGFQNVPDGEVDYRFEDGQLIVTLPAMPADSHILFQFEGEAFEGLDMDTTGFALDGTLAGEYTEEVLEELGCNEEPTPTATATDDPTVDPTADPTDDPTVDPTPTETATDEPTVEPTQDPTTAPSDDPTDDPKQDDPKKDDSGDGGSKLPRTGADVLVGAAMGVALLAIGGAALMIARRRAIS